MADKRHTGGRQHFLVGVIGLPRHHACFSYGEALCEATDVADQHRRTAIIEQYAPDGRCQAVYTVNPKGA